MTLSELISALTEHARDLNPKWDSLDDKMETDPEVLLALQPSWPFEHSIDKLVILDPLDEWDKDYGPEPEADDPDHAAWVVDRMQAEEKPKVIFIGEGGNQQYLRSGVSDLLNW